VLGRPGGYFAFFFVRVEKIYDLGLVDDTAFVTIILPLVSGGLLRFWGIAGVREVVGSNARPGYWKSISLTSSVRVWFGT